MQKIKAGLSHYSERSLNVLLYVFLIGVCSNIINDWSKSLLFFCLMPFQMCLVYRVIKNRKLHKTGMFRIATVFLLWMFFTYLVNDRWYAEGLIVLQAMLMCWYAALFVPEETGLQGIGRELFGIGMISIVCYLPFMLQAMLSVYTGKLMKVPFDPNPIGIQTAGNVADRIRIMMHPNYTARFAVFNILFSVYGALTRKKKGFHIFLTFVILLNALILAHTQSRTCYITLGAALGMIAFRGVFLSVKKKGLRLAAAALALILVFFAIVYGMNGVLKLDVAAAKRTSGASQEQIVYRDHNADVDMFEANMSSRDKIWKSALDYLKNNPKCLLVGIGSRKTNDVLGQESNLLERYNVHSSYLNVLAHLGIPGVLMVILFLLMLVRPAWTALMLPGTAESRGLFMLPVLLVTLLLMGFTETGLFISADYMNYLLMVVAGLMLQYVRLKKA